MLTGFAHAAVCVADIDEATRWYSETLGLEVLSPPYEMAGGAIERDMGSWCRARWLSGLPSWDSVTTTTSSS